MTRHSRRPTSSRTHLWNEVWFYGFLAFVGGLLLLALGIALKKDSGWRAAWGQWVGGLGSIVAAGTAVWIAVEGWRRSDEQRRADQERELASKFAVWIQWNGADLEVAYYNSGATPVFDVVVRPVIGSINIGPPFGLRNLGPTQQTQVVTELSEAFRGFLRIALDEIQASESAHPRSEPAYPSPYLTRRLELVNNVGVHLKFRDASGINWIRHADGRLVQAK
ncbi:hypothetical protein SAMN05421504_112191 [Amycolatopsis xylanica]|uniref:Uncharacterized protein n=1 Tax=Amycolatopsis xylanica TaxID=589385 RepID=A0A1H3S4B2_9PSEU|nr:hypothetical protein [Amycolatopsis xylanica]SDZ32301.1 hypothetical protein SAMN05421504_112191 [Amycolatopsis xylanica]